MPLISSVKIVYSNPFFTPRDFHSSVSSFRTSILFIRWFIQFLEYTFFRYVLIALSKVFSGSSVSSILSYPTLVNQTLNGSAFGEKIGCIILKSPSVSAQFVSGFRVYYYFKQPGNISKNPKHLS